MGIDPFNDPDGIFSNVPEQSIADIGGGGGFRGNGPEPFPIIPVDRHDIQDEKDRKEAEKEAAKRRANEEKNGGKLAGRIPNIFRFGGRGPKVEGSGNTEITNPVGGDGPAPDTNTDPDPNVPNDDVTLRPGYEDPKPTPNPTPPEVIKNPTPAPDTKLPRKDRK